MTPQSSFTVLAPLAAGREAELRSLLASMNRQPGVVDPANGVVAFGAFDRLHFARFVILADQTLADITTAYGLPPPAVTIYLAFLVDCDGPAGDFLAELVERAGAGLRRVFAHCEGFEPGGDLRRWLERHQQPAAATYVNWVGRTVRQTREENSLRQALEAQLDARPTDFAAMDPQRVHATLKAFVDGERRGGRLTLTPAAPTPLGWWLRNKLHALGVPLLLLLLAPLLLLYLPFFLIQLRWRERSDPVIAPRPDPAHAQRLGEIEDHDVTNQFSAMGTLKPGRFRRWTLVFFLWIIDYTTRHVFNRGRLARVRTIHFARWVFLDGKRRLLFASNYDRSLESYMDDFINKVAFGLNLVFSNGVGYPRTNWLIHDGAKDEQKFKYYIRRHELPTEVWYNGHPGLTAVDLDRNARIRQGIERSSLTAAEAREWVALL